MMTRKKGGTAPKTNGEIPKDQGQSADEPKDEPEDEPAPDEPAPKGFDPEANMPWVDTVGDYQAWTQKLEDTAALRDWAGSLEFRDMQDHHAELGIFVEEQMNIYGKTLGRTVDRAELDPEALQAMFDSDIGALEKAAAQVFDDVPGLDFMIYFMNDSMPLKLAALFVFDNYESQAASMSKVANFKSAWQAVGIQVETQVGYIGQTAPTLQEKIKAFLNSTLPVKVEVGSLGPTIQGSLNP